MTSSNRVTLKPGDTIGILGGGQLGRMLALAAARLGLKAQVFSPDPDSPAFDVVQNATCAEYADVEALELFASDVAVITYEFENIPSSTAMILSARRPVLPDPQVLETVQDRLAEKNFVSKLGIATARYADVSSAQVAFCTTSKAGESGSGENTCALRPRRAAASASILPNCPPPRIPMVSPGFSVTRLEDVT